ncbi:MAG: hypothetical protein HFJ28_01140 [Clostridia bacterium]|nr:hypothetical protein [Clostridia bacterium]
MKTINLRPMIPAEAVINHSEKKIMITSEQKLVYPELMLAVMGIRESVKDLLIGYEIYENGEYVAKVKEGESPNG